MLYGFNADQDEDLKEFNQRIVGQDIRDAESRQEEIQHAKNGFIGMLAGIIVGGIVGWLFLSPSGNNSKAKEIPVIRRPITAAKVQPNDPGGMEIDNQNREIYHIVDKLPKNNEEVNIIPAPEMPKLVMEETVATSDNIVEETISTPSNIENLVESIAEENSVENGIEKSAKVEEKIQVADAKDLVAVKTNSRDKITIPQKINDIEIKLQNNINKEKTETAKPAAEAEATVATPKVEDKKPEIKAEEPKAQPTTKAAKGTWYTQIIASSSRNAVEKLWTQLSSKHAFLKSYSHEIEAIKAANGSTLYRLKVGAFKTRKEAEDLNAKLKQNQISSIIKQN